MIPRILVIDDLYGSSIDGYNQNREDFCLRLGLSDITGDITVEIVSEPIAEAVFCSGQKGSADGFENSLEVALQAVRKGWPVAGAWRWALILLDLNFESNTKVGDSRFGYEILRALVDEWPDRDLREGNCEIPIAILSAVPFGHGAPDANLGGARLYVEKVELTREKLAGIILEHGLVEDTSGFFLGRSIAILKLLRSARKAAARPDGNLLLLGPTGAGKSLLAEFVHMHSVRGNKPMQEITVRSQADPALLRSQLFGYWPFAFGQVSSGEPGYAEIAHQSTLLIDEVANLDPSSQNELLEFAQHPFGNSQRKLKRMGIFPQSPQASVQQALKSIIGQYDSGTHQISVDVFLIAATNKPLDTLGKDEPQVFRLDLYHRLAEVTLKCPPLAKRQEDIPLIFFTFLERDSRAIGGKWPKDLLPAVDRLLIEYDWPGNVRELASVARGVAESTKDWQEVSLRHLPVYLRENRRGSAFSPVGELPSVGDAVVVPHIQDSPAEPTLEQLRNRLNEFDFARVTREKLYGQLDPLQRSFALLFARYVSACFRANRKPDNNLNILGSVKWMMGGGQLSATDAKRLVKRLLGIDPSAISEMLETNDDPTLRQIADLLDLQPRKKKRERKSKQK
jgi:DNA-binding NtrC family response regulator